MAHLTFIAKERSAASFQLAGPAVLGRSVDADVHVPDVFVSREHCRFEPTEDGGWVVLDTDSRNGIFFKGNRIGRRLLQHGDRIEIGSFILQFNDGDIPREFSTALPFGEGPSVTALVDTLYAAEMRPADYLRKSRKKPAWVRAREEAAEAAVRAREAAEAAVRAARERLNFSDGVELDLEAQIAEEAEEFSPQFVLVPRELAARLYAMMEQGAMVGEPVGMSAGVIAAGAAGAAAAVGFGAGPVDFEALLPRAAPAGGTNGNGEAAAAVAGGPPPLPLRGPAGPTGSLKTLWDQTIAEAQAAKDVAEEERAGREPRRKKPKEPERRTTRIDNVVVEEYRPTLRERLETVRGYLRTDVTFSDVVRGTWERIRMRPLRSAVVGVIASVLIAGTTFLIIRAPRGKPLDISKLSAKERKDVEVAQGN
jgi:pSer/pThr/pTyr-binding forkhead associated (FHA) protein